MPRLVLLLLVVFVCGLGVSTTQAASGSVFIPIVTHAPSGPIIGGCSMFPPTDPLNQDISQLPLHPNSANYINAINASGRTRLHPDFGSNPDYGIPYIVVPATQPRVPVSFEYADESDPGPYPIPANAPIEGGGDRHVLVLTSGECKLYELFAAEYIGPGWQAGSGAIFDLARTNPQRPSTWTSADAAGLPILPALVRYDEVAAGEIRHALRFTVPRSQRGFIHPATHFASSLTDPNLPPMGLRLRLKADYDLSRFSGQSLVILRALKKYGMILADNGSAWFISGATDRRWNDTDLNQIKTVPSSVFEVVDTGPIRTR
jgi:hypothetical protein